MPKQYDLVAVGNALVDIIAEVSDSLIAELGFSKGAMHLCERQQCDIIYRQLPPGREQSGGSAANTMSGFAALGGKGAFMGMLGRDQFGQVFTHDMQALGVTFSPAYYGGSAGDEVSTGRCLVLVSEDAERTMATHLGVSAYFDVASLDVGLIEAARMLYLEGYLFDSENNKRAFYEAANIAKRHSCQVALTLSDGFCVARHRCDFLDFISESVDILFANEQELLSLTESANYNSALLSVGKLARTAFMTRSEKGVVVLHGGGFMQVDAPSPTQLLDSTGAGDLFAAGTLYGLGRGKNVGEAATLGNYCASQILSHYGARLSQDQWACLPQHLL